MGAVAIYSQSLLHLPSFSALRKTKLGNKSGHKEIADALFLFSSRNDLLRQVVSSIQADGETRGLSLQEGISPQGRIPKNYARTDHQSPMPNHPKIRIEIISVFRKIRSSISRESVSSKAKSSTLSEDKSLVDSLLEVLHQSRTQVKGRTARRKGDNASSRPRGPLRNELKADYASALDTKLTRAPSNFVRRSPVPYPPSTGETLDSKSELLPAEKDEKEIKLPERKDLALQKVEQMKLPELKELAKSKDSRAIPN